MLKSGENVVMMDEIRSAEDVYGRLTDVVSTHAMLHWTLWLMPGARPEANVSRAGWTNWPEPGASSLSLVVMEYELCMALGVHASCSKGGQTTAACVSKLD